MLDTTLCSLRVGRVNAQTFHDIFYHICGKIIDAKLQTRWLHKQGAPIMTASTSIRIDQALYDQARGEAVVEHRTIAGQIEYWAKIGRAALDNPDLPVSFVAASLASMAESRESATDFVPRLRQG